MSDWLLPLAIGVPLFAATNLDDFLILLGFFGDARNARAPVIAGQYCGIGLLYGLSVIGSPVALVIPPALVGLLGLVPIGMGALKLREMRLADPEIAPRSPSGGRSVFAVAAVTVANGSDNVASYTSLFAVHSGREIAAIGVVLALMTAFWCGLAAWLVGHRRVGRPIASVGPRALPLVLIGLGVLILWKSGAAALAGQSGTASR